MYIGRWCLRQKRRKILGYFPWTPGLARLRRQTLLRAYSQPRGTEALGAMAQARYRPGMPKKWSRVKASTTRTRMQLQKLDSIQGAEVYNLGTGKGSSVLDVVKAFEKASGVKINYKIAPRRPGDIAECYADATKAKEELGWEAKYTLDDMCRDSWNFTKNQK